MVMRWCLLYADWGGVEMITRDLVKEEIDHVQDEYLSILYRIVQSFAAESPQEPAVSRPTDAGNAERENWRRFVALTYGSTADAPLARAAQGEFEIREAFE